MKIKRLMLLERDFYQAQSSIVALLKFASQYNFIAIKLEAELLLT
jgi:hypothetical protein